MKKLSLIYLLLFFSNKANAQSGCTDSKANNYNATATINDGSCSYNGANISPATTKNLGAQLPETSGLIFWNNTLWSHNDDADIKLYTVDTASAAVLQSYTLTNTINKDWEEISQDSAYIYVGDFGNNSNGNRTDLHILKIEKNSLLLQSPIIDTIYFSYSNQTSFTATGANNTNFDCEAFLVTTDTIYLFTKQWLAEKTSIYALPKTPGTHIAQLRSTINIQGLATGITYLESKKLAVLCGYSKTLQPFFYLLYDFKNNDFANGNKRKVTINLAFHQIEGIATSNGLKYYASNENFATLSIPQKLHTFDLSNFFSTYLNSIPTTLTYYKQASPLTIYPNPAKELLQIIIPNELIHSTCTIFDISGKARMNVLFNGIRNNIDIHTLAAGMYFIHIDGQYEDAVFVKQ
ncbi:MAG TPA: T9SS type A sorting domain-containing protein [Chitinophagales bacterium]|nr:T9SS type A sorting domain-containing protein [Chitinophagales bacterium]